MVQEILNKYYPEHSEVRNILLTHSMMVMDKALDIAQAHPELGADVEILKDGSLLHDIGIVFTNAPDIYCFGEHPYICHGFLGGQMLKENGLDKLAGIAERHTGAGLGAQDIIRQQLPLPQRDMLPISVEERIICFADKFYSKGKFLTDEKSIHKIRKGIACHGELQLRRFDELCEMFL